MAETTPFILNSLAVGGPEIRMSLMDLYEGALNAASLKPTAGAGNTVDIAAGYGVVDGDFSGGQGKYAIYNDAVKNSASFEGGGIPAAAANPTVHQIVAKVWDADYEAVGVNGRRWRLMVVPGVPLAGAQITDRRAANYRAGAVSLGADPWRNTMLIADVLRKTDGTITVVDRRADAKGQWPFACGGTQVATNGNGVTTFMPLATVVKDDWDVVYEGGVNVGCIIIPQDGWWSFDVLMTGSSLAVGSRDLTLEVRSSANAVLRSLQVLAKPVDTNETSVQAPADRSNITDYMTKGEMVFPKFVLGAGSPGSSYGTNRLAGFRIGD